MLTARQPMARLARVVAVGEPHHLTQRGNNRQRTFLDEHDRNRYCRLLRTHDALGLLDLDLWKEVSRGQDWGMP